MSCSPQLGVVRAPEVPLTHRPVVTRPEWAPDHDRRAVAASGGAFTGSLLEVSRIRTWTSPLTTGLNGLNSTNSVLMHGSGLATNGLRQNCSWNGAPVSVW